MATNNSINNINFAVPFEAILSPTIANVTGDGTLYGPVAWNVEKFDPFNCFDIATYTFTAPSTGVYYLSSYIEMEGVPAPTDSYTEIVTTTRSYKSNIRNINIAKSALNDNYTSRVICLADMDMNDTAYINLIASNSTKTIDLKYYSLTDLRCMFQGFMLQGS